MVKCACCFGGGAVRLLQEYWLPEGKVLKAGSKILNSSQSELSASK